MGVWEQHEGFVVRVDVHHVEVAAAWQVQREHHFLAHAEIGGRRREGHRRQLRRQRLQLAPDRAHPRLRAEEEVLREQRLMAVELRRVDFAGRHQFGDAPGGGLLQLLGRQPPGLAGVPDGFADAEGEGAPLRRGLGEFVVCGGGQQHVVARGSGTRLRARTLLPLP